MNLEGPGKVAVPQLNMRGPICTLRWSDLRRWWRRSMQAFQKPARRLHLAETISLGDRRFVAVIEFETRRFLVGGTSGSIVLLATLDPDNGSASATQNLGAGLKTAFAQAREAGFSEEHC
jgi:flagellar biogenesis protein FliO